MSNDLDTRLLIQNLELASTVLQVGKLPSLGPGRENIAITFRPGLNNLYCQIRQRQRYVSPVFRVSQGEPTLGQVQLLPTDRTGLRLGEARAIRWGQLNG